MPETVASRAVTAVSVAVLADLAVYFVARAMDVSFLLGLREIDRLGGITWYFVAGVAAVAAGAATVLAAVLRSRLAPARAARIFGWTVGGLAVASCAPLLALGLVTGTAMALALLHLVTAAVVYSALLPAFREVSDTA